VLCTVEIQICTVKQLCNATNVFKIEVLENCLFMKNSLQNVYTLKPVRWLLMAVCTSYLMGCAAYANPYYNPAKPHHTPEGFKNNYIASATKGGAAFFRWQIERLRGGLPKPPEIPTPQVNADLEFIKANAVKNVQLAKPVNPRDETPNSLQDTMQPAITWVGHATMLVQASGLNVLTDPMFSQRASPVQFSGPKRAQPPGIALADLPRIDVVLVSHNHYDHLDLDSVKALAQQAGGAPLFIVPLGVKEWFSKLGITSVKELDWWDSVVEKGVEFNLTPVQHWTARSLGDRSQTLWGGWAVLGTDFHWYYSGDTGYSKDFADTQQRFASRQTAALGGGFDIALIAVGAYEPRWFMQDQHLDPAQAVQVHKDLKAKRSVGVHWGTFELTDESLDQPPKDLAIARKELSVLDDEFFLLSIGQTRKLPVRYPQR
jgi:N-acyl-phosphatidylethanolamine-hydrolysing phospholipase D